MKVCILLLGLTWAATSAGKTLVFRAPEANAEDYRAFVLSSPGLAFPSERFVGEYPKPSSKATLTERFAQAQLSFTSGSMGDAVSRFKDVIHLSSNDQWSPNEQTVFLTSYLRLAQLEQGEMSEVWLKLAVLKASQGHLEKKYFPPPLVERYENLQMKMAKVNLSLSKWSADFRYLLINGEKFDLRKQTQTDVFDGPVRVSFLSDIYQTVNAEILAQDLKVFQPKKDPWIQGTCDQPDIRHISHLGDVQPFFSLQCTTKALETIPTASATDLSPPPLEPVPLAPSISAPEPEKPPFYKRTWFWLGMGAAIVTGIVIVDSNRPKAKPQPTASEGF